MITEDLIEPQHSDTEDKEEKLLTRVLHLQPILYTRATAAAVLAISPSSFDRHVAPHVPRHYVGGSLVRYSCADLIKFAEGRRTELPPL